jgi:predicted RNA-binding protein with PUA-like domain
MTTFLLKTEPNDYSFQDLQRDGSTVWDGVANPLACMHMRTAKPGDLALIYETGARKRISGLARITSEPYPDPKRPDLTKAGEIKFVVFDVEPVAAAEKEDANLKAIKADGRFDDFELVTRSRLSAMPVPAKLDRALRAMAGLPRS